MPIWLQAGLWGLLGALSLVVGAALAYLMNLGVRVTAAIMSFGCGILISAVAYDLIFEGFRAAGIRPIIIGAVAGSIAYALANWLVARNGARHRKRSGDQQTDADEGGAMAIAIGSMLDGIPESVVLGVSLLGGGGVSVPVFAAVFLSNLPEGLSSASGMKKAGRSKLYVFGLWTSIALLSGLGPARSGLPGRRPAARHRPGPGGGGRSPLDHGRRHHDPRSGRGRARHGRPIGGAGPAARLRPVAQRGLVPRGAYSIWRG